MLFGPVLKKARVKAGLSQEEMADKLYLSRSNVSRLENDKLELKAVDLIRWFQVTNTPEMAAAILCGVDVGVLMQLLSTVSTLLTGALMQMGKFF